MNRASGSSACVCAPRSEHEMLPLDLQGAQKCGL